MLRFQLLPFSLLSLLVAADSGPITSARYSNRSTPSSRTCNGCTVTATEKFLSYPSSVDVDTATIEQTIIPLVTVYPDGSSETSYSTVTVKANVTGTYKPPLPTDPYAHLTWEHHGVTLTYPTTYVRFFGLRGGLFTPVITAAASSCAVKDEELQIGASNPANLIVPVPATAEIDPARPTAISAPPELHSFLNAIPAVSSQFSGTNVEDCAWTKIASSGTATLLIYTESSPQPSAATSVAPVQKVTVSVLTEVTAKQQVITVSSNKGTGQASKASPTLTAESPAIKTEDNTTPIVVNPTPNTAAPQPQSQPTNSPDVVSNIAGILTGGTPGAQTTGNVNPLQGSGKGTQPGSKADQGATITTAGGAAATSLSGSQQDYGNGASPIPLVLDVGGQMTTIQPTFITGSRGSLVTAFVVAPGATITAGGTALTIPGSISGGISFPGTVISAPKGIGVQSESLGPGAPLIFTIGGEATTIQIQPTVITGSQGSITGFVLAPGSTLFPGGSAIAVSGTTVSSSTLSETTLNLQTGSRNGSLSPSQTSVSTTSNTLGIGDAIASGIGFTSAPASATGGASRLGSGLPLWCLGLILGALGGLPVWL